MDTKKLPERFFRKKAEAFNRKVKYAKQSVTQVAALHNVLPGSLEKEDENEVITQDIMVKEVDIGSATKRFDVKLQYGPYAIDYSRNGRFLALCGKSGHIAAFDWMVKKPIFEITVPNECRDVKFLHQETFVAVAEKYVTIYDNQGLEVHCLKKLNGILRMEFLPYHFLLVSTADNGFLYYLDCSIGTIVTSIPTYMGRLGVMCQNPSNGVICTGHNDGVVSMWVPSEKSYVVKMFAHPTAITSIACDQTGSYLATCGVDRKLKIWDLRSSYDPLSEISLSISASTINFSQKGLLALGAANTVQVLRDPHSIPPSNTSKIFEIISPNVNRRVLSNAYLSHYAVYPVHHVRFCPYEDVLGVGSSAGISSILCPGSAEPNYDALEENPFANKRYRQEREVKRLLDKIPYTMISLKPIVGEVRREDLLEEWEKKKAALLGQIPKVDTPTIKRNKQKGRSKPGRIEAKKQNIHFERKMFTIKEALGVREAEEKLRRKVSYKNVNDISTLSRPSEALVTKKKLAKRRTNTALDVLIPPKEV
ncbi:hypothetical protein Smp_120350 [Schistosoma mansoni]|uniref:hypothetical protein n=1 Tax=Schistosoma mansoni TaxID=6183 RepID=UPI0001A621FA|nr:hypothetical protein Smp_120350 [Schistosoma mansoni]|eukprot:XP_018644625.1 hypothetical protein Smp_120350 [Schistosoma mansoni]